MAAELTDLFTYYQHQFKCMNTLIVFIIDTRSVRGFNFNKQDNIEQRLHTLSKRLAKGLFLREPRRSVE